MKTISNTYALDTKAVDDISNSVYEFLKAKDVSREFGLRVRYCIEETLIVLLEEYKKKIHVEIKFAKKLGKSHITLSYKGRKYNPLESGKRDMVSEAVLGGLGVNQAYSYSSGVNSITYTVPSSGIKSEWMLVGSVILALLFGICGRYIPDDVRNNLVRFVLTPISELFMKFLMMVAPFIVFLSVLTGIIKSESGSEFGKMSKFIVGRYVIETVLSCVLFVFITLPFYNFKFGSSSGSNADFSDMFDLIMDIVPGNLIRPFEEGNMLQIIIISVLLGIIILGLGNGAERLKGVLIDTRQVFSSAMELVCKLLPVFIFASLVVTIWENGPETFASLWKPIVVTIGAVYIYLMCFMTYVSVKYKVSVFTLAKKILPSYLVALTTASSMAAFGKVSEINKNELGISPKYTDIAYPIGMTLFDALYMEVFLVIPFYMAEIYGIAVSPVWFAKAGLISIIVAYASPQVSGGVLVTLSILISQLGLPMDGLPIASILIMFLDFFITGAKVASHHMEMILQADHLNMIDLEVLRKKKKA
ncbi:MAG: cation:dicarboxylase symporter family transporter [Lachnospiraceae bacterium]|nr:cation:dicarboxylase symporter family transporter [Lachnospiraceae bacterium]